MIERQRKYEEGEPDLEQLQKEIGNETEELYLYLSDKKQAPSFPLSSSQSRMGLCLYLPCLRWKFSEQTDCSGSFV